MFKDQAQPIAIGKRLRELLLGTFAVLIFIFSITSYFAFLEYPKRHRLESIKNTLMPYFNLVDMNMRLSDLSEVMHLTRSFEFPQGTIRARLVTRDAGHVIYEDVVERDTPIDLDLPPVDDLYLRSNKVYVQKHPLSTLSTVYIYHYVLQNTGPRHQDVVVSVAIDDTDYFVSDLEKFVLILLGIYSFLAVVYLILRKMTLNLLKPIHDIADYLRRIAKVNVASGRTIKCPERLAGRSLEVQGVVRSFNAVADELEKSKHHIAQTAAFTSVGRTAAWVAHDIRKPWALVRSFLSMMPSHINDEEFLSRAQADIQKALSKVETRVDDILTLTRGDPSTKFFKAYDPIQAFKEIHGQYQKINEGSRVQVDYQIQDHPRSHVIPEYMDRVLENIYHNAVHAMNGAGKITFASRVHGNRVRIEISDDGPGISPEIVARIGNPFETASTRSGLGLSICKKLIEDMGGTFSIEPLPLMGSLRFCPPRHPERSEGSRRTRRDPSVALLPQDDEWTLLPQDGRTNSQSSIRGTHIALELQLDKVRKLCVLEDEYLHWKELAKTFDELGIPEKDLYWATHAENAIDYMKEGCTHLIADMDLYGDTHAGIKAAQRCLQTNHHLQVLMCSTYLAPDPTDLKLSDITLTFHPKPLSKEVLTQWLNK